jgi:hypothetical protein
LFLIFSKPFWDLQVESILSVSRVDQEYCSIVISMPYDSTKSLIYSSNPILVVPLLLIKIYLLSFILLLDDLPFECHFNITEVSQRNSNNYYTSCFIVCKIYSFTNFSPCYSSKYATIIFFISNTNLLSKFFKYLL